MSKTSLYPMKELKIIANAKDLSYLTDLLDRHTTGYTILDYISGKGHHGFPSAMTPICLIQKAEVL